MTAPLVAWLVYRDRYPFGAPEELGRVEAPDKAAAVEQAREQFPDERILVQSVASAGIAALEPRAPSGRVRAPATTKPAHNPYARSSRHRGRGPARPTSKPMRAPPELPLKVTERPDPPPEAA